MLPGMNEPQSFSIDLESEALRLWSIQCPAKCQEMDRVPQEQRSGPLGLQVPVPGSLAAVSTSPIALG